MRSTNPISYYSTANSAEHIASSNPLGAATRILCVIRRKTSYERPFPTWLFVWRRVKKKKLLLLLINARQSSACESLGV